MRQGSNPRQNIDLLRLKLYILCWALLFWFFQYGGAAKTVRVETVDPVSGRAHTEVYRQPSICYLFWSKPLDHYEAESSPSYHDRKWYKAPKEILIVSRDINWNQLYLVPSLWDVVGIHHPAQEIHKLGIFVATKVLHLKLPAEAFVPPKETIRLGNLVDIMAASTWQVSAFFDLVLPIILALPLSSLLLAVFLSVGRCAKYGFVFDKAMSKSLRIPLRIEWAKVKIIFSTVVWFLFCYSLIFFLVAAAPGPLGQMITNWLDAPILDSNLVKANLADYPNFQLFLAAAIASMVSGMVTMTACVFLPQKKHPEIILNQDGITFPFEFFIATCRHRFRAWSDVAEVSCQRSSNSAQPLDQPSPIENIRISFRSGGMVNLKAKRMSEEHLANLLMSIDDLAGDCVMKDGLDAEVGTEHIVSDHKIAISAMTFLPLAQGAELGDGKVRIIRQLSSTPVSATYLARDNSTLLVKLVQIAANANQEYSLSHNGWANQLEQLKGLKHHSLINEITVLEQANNIFAVFENKPGKSLRAYIDLNGRRSALIALAIALKVCDALEYLHDQSPPMVHGGVSPDNVILGNDGEIYLFAFGREHEFVEEACKTLWGDLGFRAPEQIYGSASPQTDIFGLGALLSYLVYGKQPNAFAMNPERKQQVNPVDQQVLALIEKCTAYKTEDRYQTIGEVKLDLTTIHQKLKNAYVRSSRVDYAK